MQLLRVPYRVLFPLILLFCVIGVYGVSGNIWDIVIMLIFGVVGFLMRKLEYPAAPLVLAFVLGRLSEESIRQSLLLSRGSLTILLSRPLAAAFLILTVLVMVLPFLVPRLRAVAGLEADV